VSEPKQRPGGRTEQEKGTHSYNYNSNPSNNTPKRQRADLTPHCNSPVHWHPGLHKGWINELLGVLKQARPGGRKKELIIHLQCL